MSSDAHFKFDGVEGESTHKDHKGEIEVFAPVPERSSDMPRSYRGWQARSPGLSESRRPDASRSHSRPSP